MVKMLFMSLALVFLVGCASTYPTVSHTLPANFVSLPVEVNIDCFRTLKGIISRCSEDYSKELIQLIRSRKLFSEVVSGENRFLDKRQISVRVDVNEVGEPYSSWYASKRSSTIRWRAWNLSGNLLDKEETFSYQARAPIEISRILDWHMKVAEDSYMELAKKP